MIFKPCLDIDLHLQSLFRSVYPNSLRYYVINPLFSRQNTETFKNVLFIWTAGQRLVGFLDMFYIGLSCTRKKNESSAENGQRVYKILF